MYIHSGYTAHAQVTLIAVGHIIILKHHSQYLRAVQTNPAPSPRGQLRELNPF